MRPERTLWGLTREEAEQTVSDQGFHSVWSEVPPPTYLRGTELDAMQKVFGLRSLDGPGIQVILAHPQLESESVRQAKEGHPTGNE